MNAYLAVLLLYSAALIAVGAAAARRTRTSADFYVANRRLGGGLLFATLLAANIGAGSTVGAAGLGYAIGLSGWWWVGSAGIGSLLLALTVGPRLWKLAAREGFFTFGDFLEFRYGLAVRTAVAALLATASVAILAGQFIAVAWILLVVAGIPHALGCLLGGAVVAIYFASGGLKGAAWVNLVQLTIKLTGFAVGVPLALAAVGGWEALPQASPTGRTGDYGSLVGIGAAAILGYLVLLVPSFIVSPGILQKVYGASDERTVRLGVGANAVALLLFAFLPVILGMVAATRFPDLVEAELALPTAITEILPFWLGALLLAAVFSAEISSADAVLFMLATAVGNDLYRRLLKPDIGDEALLRFSRRAALAGAAAGVAAAMALGSVIEALSIFYSLLSVSLLVPLVVGLYAARPGGWACLVAIAGSVAATAVFRWQTGADGWGLISPTAFGIAVSGLLMMVALMGGRDAAAVRANPSTRRPPPPAP